MIMAEDMVESTAELESIVGRRPLATAMKSSNHLDEHCESILLHAVLGVIAYESEAGSLRAGVVGGHDGFARPESSTLLSLELPSDAQDGAPAALLMMVAGWRETLRVNGRVVASKGIAVEEAFVHCGKAMIRSRFWDTPEPPMIHDRIGEGERIDEVHRTFLASAPFVVIGSRDLNGAADASPKGDPAGFIRVLDDRTLAIPDRPGNRRTDTMHNVIAHPEASLLAMTPGDDRVLEVRGRARLSTETALLGTMAVDGREPKIALVLDVSRCDLRVCDGIRSAKLWSAERRADLSALPKAARVWTDHVKRNQTKGLAARLVRTVVNERLVQAGVEMDYERNLY